MKRTQAHMTNVIFISGRKWKFLEWNCGQSNNLSSPETWPEMLHKFALRSGQVCLINTNVSTQRKATFYRPTIKQFFSTQLLSLSMQLGD